MYIVCVPLIVLTCPEYVWIALWSEAEIKKNNSERPVDALAVKNINDSLTHNLKSRDTSASKNQKKH